MFSSVLVGCSPTSQHQQSMFSLPAAALLLISVCAFSLFAGEIMQHSLCKESTTSPWRTLRQNTLLHTFSVRKAHRENSHYKWLINQHTNLHGMHCPEGETTGHLTHDKTDQVAGTPQRTNVDNDKKQNMRQGLSTVHFCHSDKTAQVHSGSSRGCMIKCSSSVTCCCCIKSRKTRRCR